MQILSRLSVLTLVCVIVITTAESMHARMIDLAVLLWPGYTMTTNPAVKPNCDPDVDIEARLDQLADQVERENRTALFEETFDREATRISLLGQQVLCRELFKRAEQGKQADSVGLQAFALVEGGVKWLAGLGLVAPKYLLAILIILAGVITTLNQHHIAFRPITSLWDYRLANFMQFTANGLMLMAQGSHLINFLGAGVGSTGSDIIYILVLGFFILSAVSLYKLLNPPPLPSSRLNPLTSMLAVPLYAHMLLLGALFFLFGEHYIAGMALHFDSIFDLSSMFLKIALFLWVGMLIKQTRLGERVFAVLTPWQLPAEVLAVVAILLLAIPTAYTGGSGILVLALGAFVYQELRKVGTRRQFALAATAMTGSTGIVLRPCILIMIIAILNGQVVSSELYAEGIKVFMVSLLVFTLFVLLTKQSRWQLPAFGPALQQTLIAARPLAWYLAVIVLVALGYGLVLDMWVDEFNAAIILPVMIIAIFGLERWLAPAEHSRSVPAVAEHIAEATRGSIEHIGALLLFIAANMVVAGVVQRMGGDQVWLPFQFDSALQCMLVLVVCLVGIGMVMESMSGVVFISATLSQIAYQYGVNPVHFWMTALVALELGFLTPPIALNHLYVRQVVGEQEVALARQEGHNFWYRHERILLPIAVMATVLLIVAFGPFVSGYGDWYR